MWDCRCRCRISILKPVITSGGLASDEKLNSTMLMGYFKYSNENVVVKFYGISGGNLHHLVMLGGYASLCRNQRNRFLQNLLKPQLFG